MSKSLHIGELVEVKGKCFPQPLVAWVWPASDVADPRIRDNSEMLPVACGVIKTRCAGAGVKCRSYEVLLLAWTKGAPEIEVTSLNCGPCWKS